MIQNQESTLKTVKLFNGEPKFAVRLFSNGVYRWAVKAHGRMTCSTKAYLKQYMKSHGYKYYIINVTSYNEY